MLGPLLAFLVGIAPAIGLGDPARGLELHQRDSNGLTEIVLGEIGAPLKTDWLDHVN